MLTKKVDVIPFRKNVIYYEEKEDRRIGNLTYHKGFKHRLLLQEGDIFTLENVWPYEYTIAGQSVIDKENLVRVEKQITKVELLEDYNEYKKGQKFDLVDHTMVPNDAWHAYIGDTCDSFTILKSDKEFKYNVL